MAVDEEATGDKAINGFDGAETLAGPPDDEEEEAIPIIEFIGDCQDYGEFLN
jgi:hypothetical protein